MKVLVIGSGGREHAIVWKLAQSRTVKRILWSPGNMAVHAGPKVEIHPIQVEDVNGLADLAQKHKMDLTIVGPEKPLVAGISDEFQKRGLKIFGPTRQAARLEGSKVFAKQFFLKYGVPTGRAEIFSDLSDAIAYARKQPKPLVVKADGLAAGKGVIICRNDSEAESALRQIMEEKAFGEAGNQVLVEECLAGPEVSVHFITDGCAYHLLASAQDHKRALDGDQGPNTGGMGAYSPAPIFTPALEKRVCDEIVERTLEGLKAEGMPYCGVLYAGLMLTKEGPKILEYNCRLGDPETQVILPRLESDLAQICLAACEGRLQSAKLKWRPDSSVCVVLAADGYPGLYRQGDVIGGLDKAAQQKKVCVFHAGTRMRNGKVVTSGGRVLGVTALGADLKGAIKRAYLAVDQIQFEGKHGRRDIAAKAIGV